jgi:membrane fusion protein (multidrug efflux system)
MVPLAACGDPAVGDRPASQPRLVVQIETVAATTLPDSLSTVGSLESPETTTISADVSGIVVFLDTPEGQPVPAGHLLARLDDAELRAAAAVAAARFENATAESARLEPLFDDGVVSRQDLDRAQEELRVARGLLDQAQTRVEKTLIRAPFSGVLGLERAQLGSYIGSGDAIVQLTRMDPLKLLFSLPEEHAGKVKVGQRVHARVGSCGTRFDGTIRAIDPVVDPATRTLRLQAVVPNSRHELRPGMSARVRVLVSEQQAAIVVPQEAVVRRGTSYLVWVLDEEDRAQERIVGLGDLVANGVHVRSGLAAGDRLVIAGHQKLRAGALTEPQPFTGVENPSLELGVRDEDCAF